MKKIIILDRIAALLGVGLVWAGAVEGFAETRPAIFGTLNGSGVFVPVNSSNPFYGAKLNPSDGVIHDLQLRLEAYSTEEPLDAKTAHLQVAFAQDGMIPLGRFACGTATVNWTTGGWYATSSGSFTVSFEYNTTPTILSSECSGASNIKLYTSQYAQGVFDYYLYFNHINPIEPYPQEVSVDLRTTQSLVEFYNDSGAASASAAPTWIVSETTSNKVIINVPAKAAGNMEVGGNLTVTGTTTLSGPVSIASQSFATGSSSASATGAFAAAGGSAGGEWSIALGVGASATKYSNIAIGLHSAAIGEYSTALGCNAKANGNYTTAFGIFNNSNANYSTTMGMGNTAKSYGATVMGLYSKALPSESSSLSATDWRAIDPLLVVGNGQSPTTASNALVILKNGDTGVGLPSSAPVPQAKLHVAGNGLFTGNLTANGNLKVGTANISSNSTGSVVFDQPILLQGTVTGDIPMYVP